MSTVFEQYKALDIDGSLISLERIEKITPYFCYPTNATAIGFEGCIMYCFIEGYGETVFAANPESGTDAYVYPLARNFRDFLRLILACGSANPIEQIVWMDKTSFEQYLNREEADRSEARKALLREIAGKLNILPMENPYEYVKEVQAEFDDDKIEYSDEYYDVLGLERKGRMCRSGNRRKRSARHGDADFQDSVAIVITKKN